MKGKEKKDQDREIYRPQSSENLKGGYGLDRHGNNMWWPMILIEEGQMNAGLPLDRLKKLLLPLPPAGLIPGQEELGKSQEIVLIHGNIFKRLQPAGKDIAGLICFEIYKAGIITGSEQQSRVWRDGQGVCANCHDGKRDDNQPGEDAF